jgi:DNA processing protein
MKRPVGDRVDRTRLLYVLGSMPVRGVAIVGSRTPPPAAERLAYMLAYRLREPVIAGLAMGIDAAAHRGALAAGAATLAFVGYGFGRTYPPEHRRLERAIVDGGGAIATLVAPGTPVSEKALIERDRLQAEHARAVVLICSELGGGAMHTMRFARQLGVPRFTVWPPESEKDAAPWAGNVQALSEGATPLPLDADAGARILHDLLAAELRA